MNIALWNQFKKNRFDLNWLDNLIYNQLKITSYIYYQINFITLKLCIKRDNLGIPIELWDAY